MPDDYQVLENGQPIHFKPRGLNDFGLPFDQPGPIVLNNEPERSLRPGEVYRLEHDNNDGTAHKIEIVPVYAEPQVITIPMTIMQKRLAELAQLNLPENVIHNILTSEFGDGYYRTLWNTPTEYNKDGTVKEGVKDGYDGKMKFDTGDDKERSNGLMTGNQKPIEFSNQYPTRISNNRYYDKSYYDLLAELNEPELGMALRDILQLPSVWLHKYFPNEAKIERPLDGIEFSPSKYNRQNAVAETCHCSGTDVPEEYKIIDFVKDKPIQFIQEAESPAFPDTPKYLNIRKMGRYVYKNKGKITPYNEKQVDHICAMLADTVWDMKDPHRPVVPSEATGWTNTHLNCQCIWDKFDALDYEPDKIIKPTRNDKPLSSFSWKGKSLEKIKDTDIIIQNKIAKDTLRPIDEKGRIRETVQQIHDEFAWMSPAYFDKLKSVKRPGKFLLIRASQASFTDHRPEGEKFRRFLSPNELKMMARTAILSNKMDINHDTPLKDPLKRRIMDSEYAEPTQAIQMLVHEDDPEILKAIDDGIITAVSINAGRPRDQPIVCKDSMCTEKVQEPRGMVLGENDGIGMTYVVTAKAGFYYNGRYVPPATPGVKTTAIEIIDNN